jgi:Glycosyl hydrolases family 43
VKKLFIISLIAGLASCSGKAWLFTGFNEPATEGMRLLYSTNGTSWKDAGKIFIKPEVGEQKVMRDPSMVKGPDGTFHLVWTSSWRGDKGFGYASSKDLLNWSPQQFIPVMQHEPTTVNVWAPELFYDDDSARFIIIWASCIPGRFENGLEADSNNHRMYATTTKDFKEFSPTQLFCDPGFSIIDAVIVKRAVKDYVLVLKDNTRPNRNLKVAFSDNPMGPFKNVSESYTDVLTEGPAIIRLKDRWLIYYDAYRNKTYGAASTSDFIHFADYSKSINVPEGHKHGTIVPVNRRDLKKIK